MLLHPKQLDCRSREQYLQGHLSKAINIPADQLFERMHELPRADEAMTVICDKESLVATQTFFQDKGYNHIDLKDWDQIQQTLNSNTADHTLIEGEGSAHLRLWEPSALISELIANHTLTSIESGLDIACGSGRDLIALAQTGISMHGIDYNQGSIDRCLDLANRHAQDVKLTCADIEKEPAALLQYYQAEQFDLIIVFRYLHRELFDDIKTLLKPGGILVYSTFMQGCEKISRPRNPRFLLAPNELANEFGTNAGFSIITDRIGYLSDDRPVAEFISKKNL